MEERKGAEMSVDERIAYHLAQINLIAEITQYLQTTLKGDEEE